MLLLFIIFFSQHNNNFIHCEDPQFFLFWGCCYLLYYNPKCRISMVTVSKWPKQLLISWCYVKPSRISEMTENDQFDIQDNSLNDIPNNPNDNYFLVRLLLGFLCSKIQNGVSKYPNKLLHNVLVLLVFIFNTKIIWNYHCLVYSHWTHSTN